MKVTEDIPYVGVNDHDIDLFEGQYVVPRGMAYNSYLVKDEKLLVFDTVDSRFVGDWLSSIHEEIGDGRVDYLVVQHMEPDHSASVALFAERHPEATLVASAQAFAMMKNFFGTDYADRRIVVKEGATLSTGAHEFVFVAAPMVHWPEVVVTYDKASKTLFSADGFGKFGANDVE
ncbi:MAG: MBL fold metallo-hydrolase, partial [Kiritimatiellae bacterium]|nr:MBL fold metallo-hydrolase [Kiritimatiellia bacterium]